MSVWPAVRPPVFCLSVHISVRAAVCSAVRLSVSLSACPYVSLPVCQSISQSVCLVVRPCACPSSFVFVCANVLAHAHAHTHRYVSQTYLIRNTNMKTNQNARPSKQMITNTQIMGIDMQQTHNNKRHMNNICHRTCNKRMTMLVNDGKLSCMHANAQAEPEGETSEHIRSTTALHRHTIH